MPEQQQVLKYNRVAAAVLILALLGAVFAAYAFKLDALVKAGFTNLNSFCNLSAGVNCEAVAASPYSTPLGIPLAALGLSFYLALAWVTFAPVPALAMRYMMPLGSVTTPCSALNLLTKATDPA